MKATKAKDLRDKSIEELETLYAEEQANLHKARRELVFRQMTDTSSIKTRRHNIARILTVLTQKKGAAQ